MLTVKLITLGILISLVLFYSLRKIKLHPIVKTIIDILKTIIKYGGTLFTLLFTGNMFSYLLATSSDFAEYATLNTENYNAITILYEHSLFEFCVIGLGGLLCLIPILPPIGILFLIIWHIVKWIKETYKKYKVAQ